jgi:transaldolase
MNDLKEKINFSLWCDFIERDFLEDNFIDLINSGLIQGATSNPDIFKNAISNSGAYGQQINMLQANEPKKIYEELAITDIKRAATILKPLHDTNDEDGFISFEVDPNICDDSMMTSQEGERLYKQINHENVMIKIPATESGYEAMRYLTSLGIAVNATLVFSPQQAIKCAQALNDGIKISGKETKAVISVFVSRLDRLLDTQLVKNGFEKYKVGIVNASKCYHEIQKFENVNIRTLFASTGVKSDDLNLSYYIDNLIFPHSVNTAPLVAIKAWETDGIHHQAELLDEAKCDKYFNKLENKGIDIQSAYKELLKDGLSSFKVSFEELLSKVKL